MSPDSPVMAQFPRARLIGAGVFLAGFLLGVLTGVSCLGFVMSLQLTGQSDELESRTFYDPAEVTESQRRGDLLIEALKKYHDATGQYPLKLADLVPGYAPSILLPTAGRRTWHYGVDRQKFQIMFGLNDDCYPCFYRGSNDDSWQGDS